MPDIDWNLCPTATHYLPPPVENDIWCGVFWRMETGVCVEAWQVNETVVGKLIHFPSPFWSEDMRSRLIPRPEVVEPAPEPVDQRRIDACLKACEGLDTELLETSLAPGGAIRFLQSQRNELKAALEGLVLFTKPKPFNSLALHNAHQAIASVVVDGGFSKHPAAAQRDELLSAAKHILDILDHPTRSVNIFSPRGSRTGKWKWAGSRAWAKWRRTSCAKRPWTLRAAPSSA